MSFDFKSIPDFQLLVGAGVAAEFGVDSPAYVYVGGNKLPLGQIDCSLIVPRFCMPWSSNTNLAVDLSRVISVSQYLHPG